MYFFLEVHDVISKKLISNNPAFFDFKMSIVGIAVLILTGKDSLFINKVVSGPAGKLKEIGTVKLIEIKRCAYFLILY
jgi:hypothetical protein